MSTPAPSTSSLVASHLSLSASTFPFSETDVRVDSGKPDYLLCPLRQHALVSPTAIALAKTGLVLNYQQLDAWVNRTAIRWANDGMVLGNRIGLVTEDKISIIVGMLAAMRLGCCAVVINQNQPQSYISQRISHAQLQGIVTLKLDMPCEIEADVTLLTISDWDSQERQLQHNAQLSIQPIELDTKLPVTGIFTSGTSGTPKLAMHSINNHYSSSCGSQALIELSVKDAWALTLPLFHIAGIAIVFRCLFAGATVYVAEQGAALSRVLMDYPVTHLSAVATQMSRLCDQNFDFSNTAIKNVLLGGSAFQSSLLDWINQQPCAAFISYGLTEMSSQVMTKSISQTMGYVSTLPGRQLHVADDGEILLAGEARCLGYFFEGEIVPLCNDNEWFRSGDLAEQGISSIEIAGRKDAMFISGGENIQPEEIEAHLLRLLNIEQCFVVPIESKEFGHRPVCFVSSSVNPPTITEVHNALVNVLPKFKWPEKVWDLTPYMGAGLKVSRQVLTSAAIELGSE